MTAMPPLSEKLAEVQALAQAIRQAVDVEIEALAHTLLATQDHDLFGANEGRLRALAHRIAAKALEQHLARKKTATKARA
jgi:hypothetical protein